MSDLLETAETERNTGAAAAAQEAHDAEEFHGQGTVLLVGPGLHLPGAVWTGEVAWSVPQVVVSAQVLDTGHCVNLRQSWHPGY